MNWKRLIADVDDLSTSKEVLMISALNIPPEDVLGGTAVRAIVLQDFACNRSMRSIKPTTFEFSTGTNDYRCWCKALTTAGNLPFNGGVQDSLTAVRADDVEVLDASWLVVFQQPCSNVLLLYG